MRETQYLLRAIGHSLAIIGLDVGRMPYLLFVMFSYPTFVTAASSDPSQSILEEAMTLADRENTVSDTKRRQVVN